MKIASDGSITMDEVDDFSESNYDEDELEEYTKKLVDDYIAQFTKAGIRSYAIKRNKTDDRNYDGLRVATMHRVKGLEFQYVFVAAVNHRIIPLPSAINKTDAVSEAETTASEKCLLYVALTRAQKGAYITSYGKKSEFLS